MDKLSMLDMNTLNAISGMLRGLGIPKAADCLISIQKKATLMIEEHSASDTQFTFSKTVKVTNLKNVLCQVPRAVVSDWGLKVGDTLELTYKDGKITIKPDVQRGGDAATQDA